MAGSKGGIRGKFKEDLKKLRKQKNEPATKSAKGGAKK